MSGDELRKAAETLRNLAGGSAPGPWEAGRNGRVGQPARPGLVFAVADCYPTGGSDMQRRQAEYIAAMHPGVGMALADWLLVQSHHVASHDCEAHCPPDGCDETLSALVAARLINGAAS